MADIKIKDATLVNSLQGTEKIPLSDGSNSPKTTNVDQIVDYVEKTSDVITDIKNTQVDFFNNSEGLGSIKNFPIGFDGLDLQDSIIRQPIYKGETTFRKSSSVTKIIYIENVTYGTGSWYKYNESPDYTNLAYGIQIRPSNHAIGEPYGYFYVNNPNTLGQFRISIISCLGIRTVPDVFLPAYYSKPTKGIPKSDLESSVQTSLNKANTALQSIPETVALKSDISELEKQIESLTERIAALENNT
jgi:hypothetical protein